MWSPEKAKVKSFNKTLAESVPFDGEVAGRKAPSLARQLIKCLMQSSGLERGGIDG